MSTCHRCGNEFNTHEPTPSGYCPVCDAEVAIPRGHPMDRMPAPEQRVRTVETMSGMPVTMAIIAVNTLVWGAMVLRGVSPMSPDVYSLWRWGANYGPFSLDGQWWRVVTNVFLHIGLWHLALNMWALWNLGALAERLFGRWLYLYIYVFCGVCGSLGSLAWHPMVTGAGASGAIFGLAGALIIIFRFGKLPIPKEVVRPILSTLMIFTVINVGFGVVARFVDNAAHLGGLAGGVLTGAIVIQPMFRGAEKHSRRAIAGLALALGLAGIWFVVAQKNGAVVHMHRAELAMQHNQPEAAIAEMRESLAHTNDADAHVQLGRAYMQAQQFDAAAAEFRLATQMDPNSSEAWFQSGVLARAKHDKQASYDAFAKVVSLVPESAQAQVEFAMSASELGRDDEAVKSLKRAIELKPDYAAAYYDLGVEYLQQHDADNSLATFQQLEKLKPNSVDAHLGLASAYKAKGEMEKANAEFQKALDLRGKPQPNP